MKYKKLVQRIILAVTFFVPFTLTVSASDYVECMSINGATMYIKHETVNFPLNPDWKIVQLKLQMDGVKESIQSYIVDEKNHRSALIEVDHKPIPISEWHWFVGAPTIDF